MMKDCKRELRVGVMKRGGGGRSKKRVLVDDEGRIRFLILPSLLLHLSREKGEVLERMFDVVS